ncbi:hypothetical protein JVU11DRAFT_7901 [Chiua virens]|nr:hypothetical protein JVU11DRAFT_7901 [Chiua virens]
MHRYHLRSITSASGGDALITPRRRAMSESSLARHSPDRLAMGVPPLAAPRSNRDAAPARPQTLSARGTSSSSGSEEPHSPPAERRLISTVSLPGQYTPTTPEAEGQENQPEWTVVQRRQQPRRASGASFDRRSSALSQPSGNRKAPRHRKEGHSAPSRKQDDRRNRRKHTRVSADLNTFEQQNFDQTLGEAERSLSVSDRNRIQTRMHRVTVHPNTETTESSQDEGRLSAKGKSIDPSNWGGIHLSDGDGDLEMQREALTQWNKQHSSNKENVPPVGSSKLPDPSGKRARRKPLVTIKAPGVQPESDESSSDSDSTNSSIPSKKRAASSDSSDNQSDQPIKAVISKALKEKGRKPRKSGTRIIEPSQQIAPTSYLGKALGRVERQDQSRARKTREANKGSGPDSDSSSSSSDSSDSDVDRSLDSDGSTSDSESTQRAPNDHIDIADLTTRDTIGLAAAAAMDIAIVRNVDDPVQCPANGRERKELHELWNLIGEISPREKVIKTWSRFSPWLQSELWKDKLNPEKSTLSNVIAAAEVLEIAHSVNTWHGDKHTKKGKPLRPSTGDPGGTGSPRHVDSPRESAHSSTDPSGGGNGGRNRPKPPKNARKGDAAKPGKQLTKKYNLTKEEHDYAVEHKLCFKCKQPGHLSNACPEGRTVSGGSRPTPPGLSTYSMHVDPDVEHLRRLADSTEWIDGINLGSCELTLDDFIEF